MKVYLKNLIKALWIVGVLAFVLVFISERSHVVGQVSRALQWWHWLFAALGILLAKMLLTYSCQAAVKGVGYPLSYFQAFRVVHVSQLAKYVPGSVWQFVARAAILRELGFGMRAVRDSTVAEYLWLFITAVLVGGCFFGVSIGSWPQYLKPSVVGVRDLVVNYWWVWGLAALGVVVFIILLVRLAQFRQWLSIMLPPFWIVAALSLSWCFFGFAFWVTMGWAGHVAPPLVYTIGLYGLSWAVGFVAPFAPAGLGVREGLLVLGVAEYVGVDQAVVLAAANRLVYVLVEVALAGVGMCLTRSISNER